MLPFFQPKKAVGVIVSRRGKDLQDVKPEEHAPENKPNHDLEMASEEILRAIDERSVKGLAEALQHAHDACEQYEDYGDHMEGDEDAAD